MFSTWRIRNAGSGPIQRADYGAGDARVARPVPIRSGPALCVAHQAYCGFRRAAGASVLATVACTRKESPARRLLPLKPVGLIPDLLREKPNSRRGVGVRDDFATRVGLRCAQRQPARAPRRPDRFADRALGANAVGCADPGLAPGEAQQPSRRRRAGWFATRVGLRCAQRQPTRALGTTRSAPTYTSANLQARS